MVMPTVVRGMLALATLAMCVHAHGGGGYLPRKPSDAQKAKSDKPPEPWVHKVFKSMEPHLQRSAKMFLHSGGADTLAFPLAIDVLLVGFDGGGGFGYKLDEVDFAQFLTRSFPTYRPSCLETGEELEISVKLSYSVQHVDMPITKLEDAIQKAMTHSHREGSQQFYNVEATKLEPLLESRVYKYAFKKDKSAPHNPFVLILINPDKHRMIKRESQIKIPVADLTRMEIKDHESSYTYRYTYNGAGKSAAWVSAHRFAVVDLSAGPCVYGRLGASEGTVRPGHPHNEAKVGPNAFPRLGPMLAQYAESKQGGKEDVERARTKHIIGALSTLLVSSVKHLFVPDIRVGASPEDLTECLTARMLNCMVLTRLPLKSPGRSSLGSSAGFPVSMETLDFAQRVLMPIIVLRNHQAFNPLSPGHAHSLDLARIKHEAKGLVQGWQELVMVEGVHSLHEHERLALAVTRALTSMSKAASGPNGKYSLQTHSILDSRVLLDEMHHAADMLASGLIGLHNPQLAKSFYNPDIPLDRKVGKVTKLGRSHGTRVVPIYVMSLAGMPENLLLDGESLVAADRDMVVVLQPVTNATSTHDKAAGLPLRFASEGEAVKVLPQDTTRHVVAGVAMVLAGVASPTERWNPLHKHRVESYMWATGAHPFGPFSNSTIMGDLLRDTAKRNAILSQVDTALRTLKSALRDLDTFAASFLQTPFGHEVPPGQERQSWLDQLYLDPKRAHAPLPHDIVTKMEAELDELESLFVGLGHMLYDHRLEEANTLASSALITTHTFQEYVRQELDAATTALHCCSLEHTLPERSMVYTYGGILLAGIAVYWIVIYLAQPNQGNTYYHAGRF